MTPRRFHQNPTASSRYRPRSGPGRCGCRRAKPSRRGDDVGYAPESVERIAADLGHSAVAFAFPCGVCASGDAGDSITIRPPKAGSFMESAPGVVCLFPQRVPL